MSDIRLYNTLSRSIEPLQTAQPGRVGMYVCGMTVYDYCHIGHARAMMTFDVVARWLRERGFEVDFVRNHTDVDDKIIRRALELGEDPLHLSERFIGALEADLAALGCQPPTHEPKVSTHIPQIIEMIATLVEGGHAYAAEGDVFFAVETFPGYGQLSGRKVAELLAGERIAVDDRKRHPADFALWKGQRPGEPAWESPWGPGRPGWHIECSAMAKTYLGDGFDIHGGGLDLVFPHHENEVAQSECATGVHPYARYWMHNGMLTLGDEKMSKSLGNIMRIRDLLDRVPTDALRLFYLQAHYRSPLPYSEAQLEEALVGMDRLYTAKEVLEQMAAQPETDGVAALVRDLGEPAEMLAEHADHFATRFGEAMDDDFNSARALGSLFELARAANRFANNRKWRKRGSALAKVALEAFALVDRALGIGGLPAAEWFAQVRVLRLAAAGHTADEVEALVAARAEARAAKDWARADEARDALAALGVILMDGPEGTTWRMQVGGAEQG